MLDAAGDEEGFREAAMKVKEAQRRLREHCEQNSLAMRSDRTQVLGYNRHISGKATAAAKPPTGYRHHKDGTIVVTHDWKHMKKASIPSSLPPFSVLETLSGKHRQVDRTLYGADKRIVKQIHSRAHLKHLNPDYDNGGAHAHDFIDGKRVPRYEETGLDGRNLTEQEIREHGDIIDHTKP